jgi:predicted O-methyltransferase YrrM
MKPTTINNVTFGLLHPTAIEKSSNRIKYNINLNSSEFEQVVKDLVRDYDFEEVVETGTFNGLGSTSVFAKTGKYVFTIECNINNFERATSNLQGYENVCVIH